MRELAKYYNPSEAEDRIYKNWLEKKYFHATIDKEKRPFTIMMPPPNVTGQLHIGHALTYSLQDMMIRFKRMQGFSALWLPGVDHAGIATQARVEKELKKERGISRHDLGREEFVKLVWDWKNKYGNIIIDQLKKLGSSCDFDRQRFTMDEMLSRAVRKTFVSYYKKGLVYRGLRIINWCPRCETALSDAEVNHKEKEGNFWHIKYKFKESDDFLVVATTRPETMLGDTAVAVNPNDERYSKFIGKTLILPLLEREIPVIADEYVDASFGTGCVKVTPCHDPNDFDMGIRHNLLQINIFDSTAKINENGGKYNGFDRFKARTAIIEDLESLNLLVKTEKHMHNVGHCDRCDTVIEPLASKQWFVKMKPLAEPAIKAVVDGDIKYVTERFEKSYLLWMENIRDWCISRQLWWGHRIPVFYCDECGHLTVSETDAIECEACKSRDIRQDEDVLDTWFSSALWCFSTLGWPDETEDLKYFYPTSLMITGYEIIPLWVARMIFSGIEFMDKKPFENVLIHGIVRDELGRKMSKSLNNGIDPLEIIEKYGADVLRFGLVNGISPGNDTRYLEDKMEAAKNFTNKLWNAAKFVLINLDIEESDINELEFEIEDKWILTQLNKTIIAYTENMEKFDISLAQQKIYEFSWDIFCDWYIELIKPRFNEKNSISSKTAQNVILHVFVNILKMLHPFMPFLTEELWQNLPKIKSDSETASIMISKFPVSEERYNFIKEASNLEKIIDSIRAVRNKRTELGVPPSKKVNMVIISKDTDAFCEKTSGFFIKLAGANNISYEQKDTEIENLVQIITPDAVIYIPQDELIDKQKEIEKLERELKNAEDEIMRVQSQLSNENFIKKAPSSVIEEKRALEFKYISLKNTITESLAKLK